MSDCRKNILPSNFEHQIFPKSNSDLWDLKDANEIVN